MSVILNEAVCEVIYEEFITHSEVKQRINGWRAEGRIIGTVKIGSEIYEFNQIVSIRLKKPTTEDE